TKNMTVHKDTKNMTVHKDTKNMTVHKDTKNMTENDKIIERSISNQNSNDHLVIKDDGNVGNKHMPSDMCDKIKKNQTDNISVSDNNRSDVLDSTVDYKMDKDSMNVEDKTVENKTVEEVKDNDLGDGKDNTEDESSEDDENDDDLLPCADEVLPLLIYVIIKTNPPSLISNITFIQNFRHPNNMQSEEAYSFTQFCSAIEFIKELGKTTFLNINENEYKQKIYEAEKFYLNEVKESNKKLQEAAEKLNDLVKLSNEKKPYTNIINKIGEVKLNFEDLENINTLTIADLSLLFQEYKNLIKLKNEILAEIQNYN
ncbi:vacuolar protein sorting-associated protein 9, putative, partial [Hepatocystis sp. ex Piliocolobus tephrosceles]